jgi:replicative DNA helicase
MQEIKENSSKRKFTNLLNDMQKKLKYNQFQDLESFKLECIDKLNFKTEIGSIVDSPVFDYTKTWLKEIKELKKTPIISTGFPKFNKKLGGGIFPGLYVIGSISSLGKTAFTLQMADQIAKNQHPVLYFSTEMPKIELLSRSISRQIFNYDRERFKDVGTLKIMRGNFYDCIDEMNQALIDYEPIAKNLTIQKCNFNTDIKEVKEIVKAYISKAKLKPVIIIDYLQTLKAEGFNERQKTDNVVAGLKDISTDFHIPVISISSFNRANYLTKVSFENFKESGLIEYTADVLIGLQLTVLDELDLSEKNKHTNREKLSKAKDEEMPRRITAVVLKQRNARAFVKQNFLFFPKNNHIQEA